MLNLFAAQTSLRIALAVRLCVAALMMSVLTERGSPLVLAAKENRPKAVATELARGADVNAAEGDGSTALHWAAYHNQGEAVRRLLKAGANPDAVTDLGVTSLYNAAMNGSGPMTKTLLNAGADPNIAMISGETPLMAAARGGSPKVAQLLIDAGATLDRQATRGQTALMWAAAETHPEVIKVLVDSGADLHIRSESWSQMMAVPPHGHPEYNRYIPHGGNTALMFAAREGDLESVKILVAAGADVDDHDAWGVTAITLAAHYDYRNVCLFLLEHGADPNWSGPGFTVLHNAIMHRDEELVRALLDHGMDATTRLLTWTPTRRSSRDYNFGPGLVGTSPYWLAARFTQPEVMRLLLEHGADPKFVHHGEHIELDGKGGFLRKRSSTTALMAAVGMGDGDAWVPVALQESPALTLESVKIALKNGAEINYRDTDGRTALDGAERLGMPDVVEYLKACGAESGGVAR